MELHSEIPQVCKVETNLNSPNNKLFGDNDLLNEDDIIFKSFNTSLKNKNEDYHYECQMFMNLKNEKNVKIFNLESLWIGSRLFELFENVNNL